MKHHRATVNELECWLWACPTVPSLHYNSLLGTKSPVHPYIMQDSMVLKSWIASEIASTTSSDAHYWLLMSLFWNGCRSYARNSVVLVSSISRIMQNVHWVSVFMHQKKSGTRLLLSLHSYNNKDFVRDLLCQTVVVWKVKYMLGLNHASSAFIKLWIMMNAVTFKKMGALETYYR